MYDISQESNVSAENITAPPQNHINYRTVLPGFPKKNIKWSESPFVRPKIHLKELKKRPVPNTLPPPIDYFLKYFTENDIEEMAGYTNIYAQQTGVNNFIETNSSEIKTFIGIHLLIGVYGLPRVRMYWQQKSRINIIANNMQRNRFFQLRRTFHVVNNDTIPCNNKDKFFKVRPLYNCLKKKCNSLEIERNLSVDEQMVPFKGQSYVKYYMRGKPHPWCFKIYLLCGSSGLVYDLLMYQEGNTEINEQEKQMYGFGGAVVLKLINDLVKPSQHYLYFDNFFTSFNLIHALDEMKIYATGTARTNRFVNPPLLSDKTMSNLGHGASFEISSAVPNTNIGMLKWYDSKSVVLVTNCVTSGTPDKVRRWNKNKKIYEKVDRPEIIRNYNTSMGGVDKHDMLISLF